MRRLLPGVAVAVLAWFFGGWVGAAIGLALILALALGARPSVFWGVGVGCLLLAPVTVLVQGLPSGTATPLFASAHWVAHVLVGAALASITMAVWLEVPGVRRTSDQEGAGREHGGREDP